MTEPLTAADFATCERVLSRLLAEAPRIEVDSGADAVSRSIRVRESLTQAISEVRRCAKGTVTRQSS